MANSHPAAVIDSDAEVAADVRVGPFAVVMAGAKIGEGCEIGAHAVISSGVTMGKNNRIYPFAAVGGDAQDKKYQGESATLKIGDGNTVREFCTLNRGTRGGGGGTVIGDDNWIMAYAHIAHDCEVGGGAVLANGVQLGGHVKIGDGAILGGLSAVHQFCRVGARAMVGGGTLVVRDIPPFALVAGERSAHVSINVEGLHRGGFSADDIRAIRRAYRTLYREGLNWEEARARIGEMAKSSLPLKILADFLAEEGRGLIRPRADDD